MTLQQTLSHYGTMSDTANAVAFVEQLRKVQVAHELFEQAERLLSKSDCATVEETWLDLKTEMVSLWQIAGSLGIDMREIEGALGAVKVAG